MSDSTTATCTEHHEGRRADIVLSCWPLELHASSNLCMHASTYASRAARWKPNHPKQTARSSVLIHEPKSVHCWKVEAHGDCCRPTPCLLVPFRLGQRQHTHTVSICNSIAPHGRARPRAVTQMALGDLQMTYLPNSAPSLRGSVQFTRFCTQKYPPVDERRVDEGGRVVRSTGMRLHNSGNLIKTCTERAMCRFHG